MNTEEKLDVILNELSKINNRLSGLEKWQVGLEKWQAQLRKEFLEFKDNTELNFEKTNILIDQAFEKISENISYQDKVTQIEKIIHSRQKNFV
jgi:hypothetical protein